MATCLDLLQMAIDEEDYELVHFLLLERREPLGVTYDPTWAKFQLDAFTEEQSKVMFRFSPDDIEELASRLALPPTIKTANGCVTDRVEALCVLLRRLSYPNRLCDLEPVFGRPASTLSLITNYTVDFLWEHHQHRLTSLDQPWLQVRFYFKRNLVWSIFFL